MKGMQWDTISLISAAFATILILHSGYLVSQAATHEMKEKLVDVQAERLRNAAIALSQAPRASNEIEMPGYEFKYDFQEKEINVTYDDESATISFKPTKMNYCEVDAPNQLTETEGEVCIERLPTKRSNCQGLDLETGVDIIDNALDALANLLQFLNQYSSYFQSGDNLQGAKLKMSPGGCG